MPAKASMVRFKRREDTPAPPTKGDCRKRVDVSPFPEDKQICKRLDFGSGSNISGEVIAPDSGRVAGAEAVGDEVENDSSCHPRPKGDVAYGTNGPLVGVLVNLPEMAMETKPLLESALVPCHNDESHVELAVGHHMQPKGDILLLANLDSADMLDTSAAQPLLTGGQPEVDQMVVVPYSDPPPADEEPLLTLMAIPSCPYEVVNAPVAWPLPTGGRPEEGQAAAVPHLDKMPNTAQMLDSIAAFVPSHEEFPPLVKGP